jgi:hypothetical protein
MKEIPFELTLAGFKESALKAIAEQRLAIQNEDGLIEYLAEDEKPACMNTYPSQYFDGKKCHCIVGPSLNLPYDDPHVDFGLEEIVATLGINMDAEEMRRVRRYQKIHDSLVSGLKSLLRQTHPLSNERKQAMSQWRQKKDRFLAEFEALIVDAEEDV